MYITIMSEKDATVTTYAWDVEEATIDEVWVLIDSLGYHMDEICYMVTEEEPFVSCEEINDRIEKKIER